MLATHHGLDTTKPYKLKFMFEYGCGGCLWADNDLTYQDFGFGPTDQKISNKTCLISREILDEISNLDNIHSTYLNPDYPPYPSLWRESECQAFNSQVDKLLEALKLALLALFEITDRQIRYKEDPDLDRYLEDPRHFIRIS